MMRIHPSLFLVAGLVMASAIAASAQPGGNGPRSGAGQNAVGSVSGTVTDSTSGDNLPAATVTLMNAADSTLVSGAITGRDGSFTIAGLRPGRYYARISYVGYRPRIIGDIRVTPRAPEITLGSIALMTDASISNEVNVTAQRDFMTTTIDRTIYRTEDLLVSSGGNATDVLRNIPSVEVDIDGNIALRGNQNVAVQINGRPVMMTGDALANFLQTLPADALDRIEVIANPSAKFDPEGMAGILNIELKQGQDRGLSGGVNAGIGTQNNYNIGANISYGSGPWSLFANYGLRTGDREGTGYRFQENRLAEPYSAILSRDTGVRSSFGHSFNTSIDYAFNKEHSLSYTTFLSTRTGDDFDSTFYTDMDASRLPLDRYLRSSTEVDDDFNMDHRLNYKWVGDARKHELSAELRYGYETEEESSDFSRQDMTMEGTATGAPFDLQRNRVNEKNTDYSLQADYIRPLWDGARLEAGYKGTLRSIDNDFFSESFDSTQGEFMPDLHLNNTFIFDEQIHAVYGMIGQELGDVGMLFGLRAEQAKTTFDLATTGESYDNSYTSLFPSAFLTYQAAEATQLKLSYSKRINRPGTWSINPFSSSSDPLFRRVGNPYLRPEYTHAYEFTATQYLPFGTIAVSPYFRRTVDAIEHYQRFDSNGVTTTTFENFGQVDSYGAELITSARVGDWLTATGNVSLYKSVTDASNVDNEFSADAIGWSARLNTTVSLGWGTDVQASFFYRAPRQIGGGEMRGMLRSEFAVQKKFLDDRLKLGLRVDDPFNQSGFSAWRETDTYYSEFERRRGGRTGMLTLSYVFGAQDKQKRRERGGGSDGGEMEDMGW